MSKKSSMVEAFVMGAEHIALDHAPSPWVRRPVSDTAPLRARHTP